MVARQRQDEGSEPGAGVEFLSQAVRAGIRTGTELPGYHAQHNRAGPGLS